MVKTFNVGVFLVAIKARSFKLGRMIAFIALYLFMPFSVAATFLFQVTVTFVKVKVVFSQ